ncbi:hypothetical protein K469DRAFT_673397 [Zopfia rhizophila CBS 207.26]|uniref:Uncharacterized protein n=1 Tax=Zopfia rhizophila CBS 207.26 TaxID=1314779 RepID=A0A6A6DNX5_9PEZI|nr:hypothetical protein K469DRAFT_673397 [Zopfia rhizophila CBS 207.26]
MYRAHGVSTAPLTRAQTRRAFVIPKELKTKGRGLDGRRRLEIYRYLLLGWHHDSIADFAGVSVSEVYAIERNLKLYGSTRKPSNLDVVLGRPRKIEPEDETGCLFQTLYSSSSVSSIDFMAAFIEFARKVDRDDGGPSRCLFKGRLWSKYTLRLISINHNKKFYKSYYYTIRLFTTTNLVFLNKLIFNKKTS